MRTAAHQFFNFFAARVQMRFVPRTSFAAADSPDAALGLARSQSIALHKEITPHSNSLDLYCRDEID
jgi:hypothetical protein